MWETGLTHTVTHTAKCPKSGGEDVCLILSAALLFLHHLRHEAAHGLCGFVLFLSGGVGVGSQGESCIVVAQHTADSFHVHAVLQSQRGECVPLRYNNDKQKKPLFSRGLSVCRLLFNSFSKLKIDENYKEKRRLFY